MVNNVTSSTSVTNNQSERYGSKQYRTEDIYNLASRDDWRVEHWVDDNAVFNISTDKFDFGG